MKTQPLPGFGVQITDVDLADGAKLREVCQALPGLLAEHGVAVLPGHHIDDEIFVDFLNNLGELTFTTGETPIDGYPDLNLISN